MAISATAVGRIQTDGSDSNGGFFDPGVSSPGTDYSGQAAAQIAYTDLVIGAGTSTLTSVANPFTSSHPGNSIRITGGTGFTVGTYIVLSVAAGVATMDRAVGTAASTGGTGNLGGYLLSPGMVGSIMSSLTSGYTVNTKVGTYNMSNTSNVSGGRLTVSVQGQWYGFTSTPGDITTYWGTKPIFRANANSVTCVALSAADSTFAHLEFDGNNGSFSATAAFVGSTFRFRATNCKASNSGNGANGGFNSTGGGVTEYCEAVGGSNSGFFVPSAKGCLSRGNTSHGYVASGPSNLFTKCASYLNGGAGYQSSSPMNCDECDSVSNTLDAFQVDVQSSITNSIAYGNGGYAFGTTASALQAIIRNCFHGSNTSGGFNSTHILTINRINNATLSADPYTSKSTLDFSHNNTAGGGAVVRSAGFGNFPGSASVGYPDGGSVRHQDAAAGGMLVNPGMSGF